MNIPVSSYNAHTPHHSFLSFMSHTPADPVTGHTPLLSMEKLPDLTSVMTQTHTSPFCFTLLALVPSSRSFFSYMPHVPSTLDKLKACRNQVLLYYSYNYYYYHFCFVFCDAFSLILCKFTSLHSLQ